MTKHGPRLACAVRGCDTPARSRGLCPMHYSRWLRHGSTDRKRRANHGEVARATAADVVIALAVEKMLAASPERVCDLLGLSAAELRAALARRGRRAREQIGRRDRLGRNRTAPPGCKWCNRCERYRLLGEFNRSGVSGDGRQKYCAGCSAAYMRDRRAAS